MNHNKNYIIISLVLVLIIACSMFLINIQSIENNYSNLLANAENEFDLELELAKTNFTQEKAILEQDLNNEKAMREKVLLDKNDKIAFLKEVALYCYWAVNFYANFEETIEHFDGENYSKEYYDKCFYRANEDWNLVAIKEAN